jgi:hypothetical protein
VRYALRKKKMSGKEAGEELSGDKNGNWRELSRGKTGD